MIQPDKVHFYEFLNGETSISDFEKLIYSNPNWEQYLGEDVYLELANFDFKDKNSTIRLREFIRNHIIETGEFETWKLKALLSNFLNDVQNMPVYLEKCYDLYCGVYLEDGSRKFMYKFLGNLGLNYFFWKDENYLSDQYGEKWKSENEKITSDYGFYHKQLKPVAEYILKALDNGEIQIHNDGTYTIGDNLKTYLESDKITDLKHPKRNNDS